MSRDRSWRFCANLSFLFPDLAFLDRFGAAKAAGFDAVEYVCLYDHAPEVFANAARSHGLNTILLNVPHGGWDIGERGIAILPDRRDEFAASLSQTIAVCAATGCGQVNCLAGLAPQGIEPAVLRETFIANLRHAAPILEAAGIRLLIEPINTVDMPGFFLSTADDAIRIINAVGVDNLFLQFDCYHEQMVTADALRALERHIARIGHVQIADVPGRHEPGTGGMDCPAIFATLDRLGYRGHVGCEYRPKTSTVEGLSWMGSA